MKVLLPEDTLRTFEIDEHYERTGMLEGWTVPRVNSLARMMKATPFELGKLCGVSFKLMHRYIDRNEFPPPVCIHFSLLEAMMLRLYKSPKKIQAFLPWNILLGEERKSA